MQNLQKQLAQTSVRWGYPHPFLTVESLTGQKEVWRLTGYQSSSEQKKVAQSLETNVVVRLALGRIEDQIRVLAGSPATIVATFCGGKRDGHTWRMGRGHYLVIANLAPHEEGRGAAYRTPTGVRYWISAARTRQSAEAHAAEANPRANVFAVRPAWGMPALEWTRHDPGFWNSSPVVKRAAVGRMAAGAR